MAHMENAKQTKAQAERTVFDQDIDQKVSKSAATDRIRSKFHQKCHSPPNLVSLVVAVVTIVFVQIWRIWQAMAQAKRTYFDSDTNEKVSKSVATDRIRSKIHRKRLSPRESGLFSCCGCDHCVQ